MKLNKAQKNDFCEKVLSKTEKLEFFLKEYNSILTMLSHVWGATSKEFKTFRSIKFFPPEETGIYGSYNKNGLVYVKGMIVGTIKYFVDEEKLTDKSIAVDILKSIASNADKYADNDYEFIIWNTYTRLVLKKLFGSSSVEYKNFINLSYHPFQKMERLYYNAHLKVLDSGKKMIESFIDIIN